MLCCALQRHRGNFFHTRLPLLMQLADSLVSTTHTPHSHLRLRHRWYFPIQALQVLWCLRSHPAAH